MKIGVDARPLASNPTGIGYYLSSVLNELQQIDQQNIYYLISNSKIDFKILNHRWFKMEGSISGRLVSSLWTQFSIPILAKKLELDLFWGTRHHLPILLNRKIKTVLNIYDLTHWFYPETMALPNLILERLLMRISFRRANCVITTSMFSQKDIARVYNFHKKISLIYPGVPPFTDMSDKKDETPVSLPLKYFLFVGTLEPRKNFDRLFEAYCESGPAKHQTHLVIAGGKGWKNKHFINILKTHPLKSFVHLTGYVSRPQLKKLYENAVALLFPSLYEGFGFPILEAMHCGTPVICSTSSSMPEVSSDAAITINPLSKREILEGLQSIINDSNLRKRLSISGKCQAAKFSWEQCAKQTLYEFSKLNENNAK